MPVLRGDSQVRDVAERLSVGDLEEIYNRHPLQLKTILARARRNGRMIHELTEADLAFDDETELTDQNHIGGARFTRQLAAAARVGAGSTVVDVGCGLGGSTRLLASETGCMAIGIERESRRFRDAVELTDCVRLAGAVSFVHGDAETMEPPEGFDVLWGQSAWIHFADPGAFFRRWCAALPRGGHIAVEEMAMARDVSRGEQKALDRLGHLWGARFAPLDEWIRHISAARCRIVVAADETQACDAYYARLLQVSLKWPGFDETDDERTAWMLARTLLQAGVTTYFRIVGKKE